MSSSSLKQQISSAFGAVGLPSLSPAMLSKISQLSTSTRMTPSQLAEAWEAHSLTKGVEALTDATWKGYQAAVGGGSAKNVTVMTGTGLGKRAAPGSNVTPSPVLSKRPMTTTPAASATAATPAASGAAPSSRDGLSAVDSLTTPSGRSAVNTPAGKQQQAPGSAAASLITPPKAATPSAAPAKKYKDRAGSGQVVASYNPRGLPTALEVMSSKPASERDAAASRRGCTVSTHPMASHPSGPVRHMFTPLERRSAALEGRLNGMSDAICLRHGIKSEDDEFIEAADGAVKGEVKVKEEKGEGGDKFDSLWTPVGLPKQNKVICVGRICNEVRFSLHLLSGFGQLVQVNHVQSSPTTTMMCHVKHVNSTLTFRRSTCCFLRP